MMERFLSSRWILAIVLVSFVALKIPHLLVPFYWDESWPYVPAIKEMYRNGVSLLPGAIDTNLSRGHPLFFHVIGALWMHVFGGSNLSLHVFALTIAILFLIVVYEACYRMFNPRVAVIALLLVATHVSFFVQSSFVLFEVLVAFLSFLSIYLYVKEKYLLAALSLTALFLTKESGMIAGFVIGIDTLYSLTDKQVHLKRRILKLLPVTVACSALGSFFLLQKHLMGWYVLPLYTDTILKKWPDIFYRFRTCTVPTVFCEPYQYITFICTMVCAVIVIVKERTKKSFWLLCIVLTGILVCLIANSWWDQGKGGYIEQPVFTIFLVANIATIYTFSTRTYFNAVQRKFILLAGFFMLSFLLFSSAAYFISRYLLASIIPLLVLVAIFLDLLLRRSYNGLYYPLLCIIVVTSFLSFKVSRGKSDVERGFYNALKVQAATVRYLEQNKLYDKHISACYLNEEHLKDPNTGFRTTLDTFKNVGYGIDTATDLVILDNIETDSYHDAVAKDSMFQVVHIISIGDSWCRIYGKKL